MRFVFGIETTGIETTRERKGATMKARNSGFMIGIGAAVAFLLAAAMPARADMWSGLVGWWKFDEISGTTAQDSTGSGKDGAFVSAPTWTAGYYSNALSFDGSDDYVNVTNTAGLPYGNAPRTISFWFYSTRTPATAHGFLGYGSNAEAQLCDIVTYSGDNTIAFHGYAMQSGWGEVPYTANTWTFFTFTYDGTSTRIYTNAVLADADTLALNTVDGGSLRMGWSIFTGAGIGPYQGKLDDVRIYNRALSATDIAELYAWSGEAPPASDAGGLRAKAIVLEATNTMGSLQWQKSADSAVWTNVAGATSNSLDVTTLYTNTPWFHVVATMVGSPPVTSQWMKVTAKQDASGTIITIR